MSENGAVDFQIQNNIGTITFFHPKSNSLPCKLLNVLAKTIEEAGQNRDIRVIILKSGGEKAFCAGASFDELLDIKELDTGIAFFSGFARVLNAMRKCPRLIIGRIHGKAVGGGVGLVSACDYTYAHEGASVKLSEFLLGIGPFVVGPAVQRKIGVAAFSALSMDCGWYDAKWAEENNLYNRVFDTVEELDKAVAAQANRLSNSSPEAAAELKKIFWEGTEDWDELLPKRAAISARLCLSDFTKDYINQFKGK